MDERRAEPLHGAGGDEDVDRAGKPADERRDGEDRDADHEDPPAAEQVGETAAEQQEAAEGDRVRREHPLEVRVRDVEATP